MDELTRLRELLYREIPLTRAMGVEVDSYDGNCLVLAAPLLPNTNHKDSAFGGSLYSLAVLSGWGLLQLKLQQRDVPAHIVIRHSQIDYIRPVSDDIKAMCCFQSEQQVDTLINTYQKKNLAGIRLNAIIKQGGNDAVFFSGKYAIHR